MWPQSLCSHIGAPKVYSFSNPPVSEEHGSSEEARGWARYFFFFTQVWVRGHENMSGTTTVSPLTASTFCSLLHHPRWHQQLRTYLPASAGDLKRLGFNSWVGKIPWRRVWQPPPVVLPEESHEQRSLVGYSLWGRKEPDTTKATQHIRTLSSLPKISGQQVCHAHHIHQQERKQMNIILSAVSDKMKPRKQNLNQLF